MLQQANATASRQAQFWSAEEWDMIARELQKRFPIRKFNNGGIEHTGEQDIEEAAEMVLPMERHHSVSDIHFARDQLRAAFGRLAANPDQIPVMTPTKDTYVRWTYDEWDRLALETHRRFPTTFARGLDNLRPSHINEVVMILPPERRKYFDDTTRFKHGILKAWEMIPDNLKQPKAVQFKTSITEPAHKPSDDNKAMASAIHHAFRAEGSGHKPRSYWKEAQYMQLANEMIRQNPHAGFLTMQDPTHDLEAVRAAVSALVENGIWSRELYRYVSSRSPVRDGLITAFKLLRLEQMSQSVTEPEEMDQTTGSIDIEDTRTHLAETTDQQSIAPEFPANAALIQKLAAAAQPLVSLFVAEIAKAMAPEIIKALKPILTKEVDSQNQGMPQADLSRMRKREDFPIFDMAPSKPAVEVLRPDLFPEFKTGINPVAPVESKPEPVPEMKELNRAINQAEQENFIKKAKIAILGPNGHQKTHLMDKFPEFKLIFVDNHKQVKAAAHACEVFIVSRNHQSAPSANAIKQCVPKEKLKVMDGGMSGIERAIYEYKANHQ